MPRKRKPGQRPGANRTDLLAQPGPSRIYGQGVQRKASLQVVPLRPAEAPQAAQTAVQATRPSGPLPGELPDFLRPTERPDEPFTAGLSTGPGPGPEILGPMGPQSVTARQALRFVEEAVSGLDAVSTATLNLLRELRTEARGEFTEEEVF